MLTVRTNNLEFRRFKSYKIESSLDTLADGFSFVIGNPNGVNAGAIIEGQQISIFEDGVQLMVGEIDTVIESNNIEVSGRDLMVRAIENDVEHQQAETKIHPVKEIQRLAKEVGLTKFDTSALPTGIKPIELFTLEAGESTAEVMVRLAESGTFNIWLDRFGVMFLAKLDFDQTAGWTFVNGPDFANCDFIRRRKSAANLKAEIWAFLEAWDDQLEPILVKHTDQALIRAGLHRRKTLLDGKSGNYEQGHKKLVKLMDELKQRSKEWDISYGGSHVRENAIPEPGKTALVTSMYSDVQDLKALVVSVTLTKDENGTRTKLILRERA